MSPAKKQNARCSPPVVESAEDGGESKNNCGYFINAIRAEIKTSDAAHL